MASMAGAPRVRSLNITTPEAEARPVLVPGGNKARSAPGNARKPSPKPPRKAEAAAAGTPEKPAAAAAKEEEEEGLKRNAAGGGGAGAGAGKGASPLPSPRRTRPGPPPRKSDAPPQPSLSLNVSCSSDASAESIRVRASAGRVERSRSARLPAPKLGKAAGKVVESKLAGAEVVAPVTPEAVEGKMRCAWVTPTTDPCYASFHDEEWGVPVHDDRRLFELLVLSGALAELTWPEILKRRQIFREIFMDFNPAAISKINEKKLVAPGSIANSLLSEQKLRAVLENARQMLQIADEFGSFDRYCWGFLNHKPAVASSPIQDKFLLKAPRQI